MNQPSKDLFDQIIKQGTEYINDAITNKQVENYYLDFKSTEKIDYSGRRSLYDNDRKNYAKSISAFGNSDGGVVIWGIKTGSGDSDFAVKKESIQNVSTFVSLLEGFTSTITSPPHADVVNKIIFEDESKDIGYVITHIPKSNKRPFQVTNDNDFRYYIRAGSNSKGAPDIFLRSLFGREPQPDVFNMWTYSPAKIINNGTIQLQIGFVLHNGGETVAKNINGYVQVLGGGLSIEINQNLMKECFSYSKNDISGLKIGFMAKDSYKLGIEQEVLPLTIHVELNKENINYGMRIISLSNCDNQMSYRLDKRLDKDELIRIYDAYMADNNFDIAGAIIGKDNTRPESDTEHNSI